MVTKVLLPKLYSFSPQLIPSATSAFFLNVLITVLVQLYFFSAVSFHR